MKRLFFLTLIIFLSVPLVSAEVFISGIQIEGSDVAEPDAKKSKYLKVNSGGFKVEGEEAFYQIYFDILKTFDKPMSVKLEFMNPQDKKNPFVKQGELPVGQQSLTVWEGPVKGLKISENYWVKIHLYDPDSPKRPVDRLRQKIRSYVDTTTEKVTYHQNFEISAN